MKRKLRCFLYKKKTVITFHVILRDDYFIILKYRLGNGGEK